MHLSKQLEHERILTNIEAAPVLIFPSFFLFIHFIFIF